MLQKTHIHTYTLMYWDVGILSIHLYPRHHLPSKQVQTCSPLFNSVNVTESNHHNHPSPFPKRSREKRSVFCHWHKQSHLAPWKSKKLEDVFLWFGLIFRDNGQFWGDYIQKIPVLVGCLNPNALKKIPLFRGVFCWISFSGSLIQIFQIFQLPLRTTKLVCRLKRKWTNHLQVIFVVGPAYNYQPSRGGMKSSLITFESLESHWHLGNFAFMAYENWNASTRHDLRPRQSLVGRSLNPRTWMSQEISKWLVSGL